MFQDEGIHDAQGHQGSTTGKQWNVHRLRIIRGNQNGP